LQLPSQELWQLEEKFDVPVERIYGSRRILAQAPLAAFLILDWQRNSDRKLEVEPRDLDSHRQLLAALMKPPGPFYQYPDGTFQEDTAVFDESAYLQVLEGVAVYVARGRIDFSAMANRCLQGLPG